MSNSNFIDAFKRARPADGRDRLASQIRKLHRQGPSVEGLAKGVTPDVHASVAAIRKAHADGPQPLFTTKGAAPQLLHLRKLSKHERLAAQVASAVRKAVKLPPQSENGDWEIDADVIDQINTGATNDFSDEPGDVPKGERLGGFNDVSAKLPQTQDDGNGDATVAAIKAAYRRGPKRMAP